MKIHSYSHYNPSNIRLQQEETRGSFWPSWWSAHLSCVHCRKGQKLKERRERQRRLERNGSDKRISIEPCPNVDSSLETFNTNMWSDEAKEIKKTLRKSYKMMVWFLCVFDVVSPRFPFFSAELPPIGFALICKVSVPAFFFPRF